MTPRLAADAVVALHLVFIVFVVAGGTLSFGDRRWAIVHLPAVAWAAWTEFTATVCPLTPWENALRAEANEAGYMGSFIDHYIVPLMYPQGLTQDAQIALGVGVIVLNAVVYSVAWRRRTHGTPRRPQVTSRAT